MLLQAFTNFLTISKTTFLCAVITSENVFIFLDACVAFLKRQAKELDLPARIYEIVTGKPIVIITWTGTKPDLPSIILNSHMDVVPVFPVS
jgi:acetylornithine deacetylase/succinyl-diaminopimelate desuccinylase-like protein